MRTKSFSYQRLKARRDKIFFNGLRSYTDATLSGDTITDVCNSVAACLPGSVLHSALFESIRVLAGTTLTMPQAKILAWRLAGNIDKLIDGAPVLPWRAVARAVGAACWHHLDGGPTRPVNREGHLRHQHRQP
jgi:hypothetical protein